MKVTRIIGLTELKKNRAKYMNISMKDHGPFYCKMLHPDFVFKEPVDTLLGKVVSMRRVMLFIGTRNYPYEFLTKPEFTKKDKDIISSSSKRTVDHYWTILGRVLIDIIMNNKDFTNMLKNYTPDTVLTSFKLVRNAVTVCVVDKKMIPYIEVLDKVLKAVYNNPEDKDAVIKEFTTLSNNEMFKGVKQVVFTD